MNLTIESSICVEAGGGWVAFDLDSTIAMYPPKKGDGSIGQPIMPMIDLIKRLRKAGVEVRIFTARVGLATAAEKAKATKEIQAFCLSCIGESLPVTAMKDHLMIALFDDRAVQVESNTGKILGDPERIKGWPLNKK